MLFVFVLFSLTTADVSNQFCDVNVTLVHVLIESINERKQIKNEGGGGNFC